MALLLKSDATRLTLWYDAFHAQAPELEVRTYPELGRREDIEYALLWQPPPGLLATLPNLKVVFSVGAGIDHLLKDPELPRHLPLVRMVEDGLTAGMSEYVVMSVLLHHRFMIDYRLQQQAGKWEEIQQIAADQRTVAVLGMGEMGQDALKKLGVFGFKRLGWSRTPKEMPGVECFHGAEGLKALLPRAEILVCLLPLTDGTRGLLNADLFSRLPRGAALINAGRGGHQDETALLAALDSGQLSGASLDVYQQEPGAAGGPLWKHPRIIATPHVAAMTMAPTAVASVVANIRRFEAGQPMQNVVDLSRQY